MADMAPVRRALLFAYTLALTVFATLGVMFGLVVDKRASTETSCRTGLYDGPYADLLAPSYLVAFFILAAAVLGVAVARGARRLEIVATVSTLGALSVFALAALDRHELTDLPALIALLASVPVLGGFAGFAFVRLHLARRRGMFPADHAALEARFGQAGLWLLLGVALPASLAVAWINAAGLFCF